jgi:hypothetical protein
MTTHSTHEVPPGAWRCTRCGAMVGSIDARVRCEPIGVAKRETSLMCDCQCPEPASGAGGCSEDCPIHGWVEGAAAP